MRFVLPKYLKKNNPAFTSLRAQRSNPFSMPKNHRLLRQAFAFLAVTIVLFTILPAYAQNCTTTPTNGLVGHWPLDDASGNAVDVVNGNNGSVVGSGTVTYSETAPIGTGVSFSGDSVNFSMGNPAALQITGAVTVSGWFKPDIVSNTVLISKRGSSGNRGYRLETNGSGLPLMAISQDGINNVEATSSIPLVAEKWHHIVGVFEPSTRIAVYMDGVMVAENTTSIPSSIYASTQDFHIANWSDGATGANYTGAVDDVRVYNRALSAEEIGQLYEYGFGDEGAIIFDERHASLKYCNGTDWVHAGVGSYVPNAVTFDGSNDYFTRGAQFTGATDTKLFSGSFWFRRNTSGTTEMLMEGAGFAYRIQIDPTDEILVSAENSSGTTILSQYNNSLVNDSNWHHLMFSFDMSDSNKRHIYIDDVSDIQALPDTYIDDFIDATVAQTSIGGGPTGALKFSGDLADVWIDFGTYIDLSIESNRRAFISERGMPMYLGSDGSLPTGETPDIFLSGPTDDWHTNKGTGGGFTENGAITYSSSRPGASLIQDGDIATGLVGYWTLDEASGTFADSSPNSNTGTQSGGVTYGAEGIVNSGAGFDGTDDVVLVPNDASLENFTAFTLAAWVYPTALADAGGSRVISKSDGGTGDNYNLGYAGSDTSWIRVETDGDVQANINGNVLPLNTWTHLVGTWDGTNMRLYENGVEVSTSPVAKSGVLDADGTQLGIGGHPTAADRFFPGNLDEIRIYNRALSETDIQNLYRGGIPGKIRYNIAYSVMEYFNGAEWVAMGTPGGTPPTNGLVGHWELDESGNTSTAADSVGSNNGTLTNFPADPSASWQSAVLANGLDFDGNEQKIDLGNSATIDPTLWTWCFWAIREGAGEANNWQELLGNGTFQTDGTTFNFEPEDTHFTVFVNRAGARDSASVNMGYNDVWRHYCASWDGTNVRVYVDGELGATSVATSIVDSTSSYFIGGNPSSNDAFDGKMDDVRVYDRVLSGTEIRQLYHFGLSGGLGDVDNGCTSPARPEGTMLYNVDNNIMQYCNGEEWVGIGQ